MPVPLNNELGRGGRGRGLIPSRSHRNFPHPLARATTPRGAEIVAHNPAVTPRQRATRIPQAAPTILRPPSTLQITRTRSTVTTGSNTPHQPPTTTAARDTPPMPGTPINPFARGTRARERLQTLNDHQLRVIMNAMTPEQIAPMMRALLPAQLMAAAHFLPPHILTQVTAINVAFAQPQMTPQELAEIGGIPPVEPVRRPRPQRVTPDMQVITEGNKENLTPAGLEVLRQEQEYVARVARERRSQLPMGMEPPRGVRAPLNSLAMVGRGGWPGRERTALGAVTVQPGTETALEPSVELPMPVPVMRGARREEREERDPLDSGRRQDVRAVRAVRRGR